MRCRRFHLLTKAGSSKPLDRRLNPGQLEVGLLETQCNRREGLPPHTAKR